MSAAWTVRDSEGQLVVGPTGASRIEVARKILPGRYDPFRLHVSASYREMFERDLRKALAQKGWQIMRAKARPRRNAGTGSFRPAAAAA